MTPKRTKDTGHNYTLMIVPHFGKQIISWGIPVKTIKYASVGLGVAFLAAGVALFGLVGQAKMTASEKNELVALREESSKRQTQIEEMAKNMAVLQDNMNQLNQLDKEVRVILADLETEQPKVDVQKQNKSDYNTSQGGPGLKPTAEDVGFLMKDLEVKISDQNNRLNTLKENAQQAAQMAAVTPSIWPTSGEVTSPFGWRKSPWGAGGEWHPGIDIANDYGTPILSAAKGVVSESGYVSGYGNMIVINHGYGIETAYGHNAKILVKEGQTVQKGQIIAHMGSTGLSTGPHLHYEVRKNKVAVNPNNFLQ